jgi:hypothetical protein
MAKYDKDQRQESISENAAEIAGAARRAAHAAKEAAEVKEDSREEFRKFFAQKKSKLNLSASLESVVWLHLKAYGFDKKESFSSGLKHFGIGE